MKLLHQINLAFGLLLVLVLGLTAVLIHYVLMDHFMVTQKQELTSIGSSMATNLELQATQTEIGGGIAAISQAIAVPAGVEAYIVDEQGRVVSDNRPSSVSANTVSPVSSISTISPASSVSLIQADPSALPSNQVKFQAFTKSDGYLVNRNVVPQGTLTLRTPISKINAIERELFGRLLIVLGIGAALVLLLSLLITRKLIRPLMKLREELKKVQVRQFADVKLIKTGGEIGAVAQTVYELAGELDRYNRVQKQFFQNASHELKTPLMSIAGYAEGIRDGVFEGESSRKGLDIILSESGRLTKIVTEMTLLAKLDSEEDIFQPTVVSVREMLTDTAERINPLLGQRGLTLQTVCSAEAQNRLTVRADRDKLMQALLNVVSNAARYAKNRIVIEAGIENGRIVITVTDDGKGFPESLLPHLFHRFVKGKDGETGLGLAISRAIVERCGGLIRAGNRDAGGAVISLSFPAAAA
ncbi:sensor histidine kinase [Cohnella nanjingensis]|uniref:histidine kinase n=1 Tax=Cohnella nanjingensis TaxID=1387779 RepID=A0A7X0RZ57_9BACL|nr:HAMP domain-containing sensor histidine kinase [Cohnella nanjingensis]MBB6675151.1 HAMP domain-containing histidine kinase [Cohnella nanjingensis]